LTTLNREVSRLLVARESWAKEIAEGQQLAMQMPSPTMNCTFRDKPLNRI